MKLKFIRKSKFYFFVFSTLIFLFLIISIIKILSIRNTKYNSIYSSEKLALLPTVQTPGVEVEATVPPMNIPIPDPTSIPIIDSRTQQETTPEPTAQPNYQPQTDPGQQYTGGIGNIGTQSNEAPSTNNTQTTPPQNIQAQPSNSHNVSNPDQNNESKNNSNITSQNQNDDYSRVELMDNYYQVTAKKDDLVELPQLNNKCNLFEKLTFKTKEKISGRIFINNTKKEEYKNIPSNNLDLIYGACEIKIEGFDSNLIDDIKIILKFSQDWFNKNEIRIENIKLLTVENPDKVIDNRHDTVKLDKHDNDNYFVESKLEVLPEGFLIYNAKPKSLKAVFSTATSLNPFNFPYQTLIVLIPALFIISGLLWYRKRGKALNDSVKDVMDITKKRKIINW